MFFVAIGIESLVLRLGVAPAFGAMFDDFGGRDTLPMWTRAWVYGAWPYLLFPAIAACMVGFALITRKRRGPGWPLAFAATGFVLFVANVMAALLAFYLPLFSLAECAHAA